MILLREHIREVDTPHFTPEIRGRIYSEEYVRVVLGIDLPLNESRPYSLELQQRILEEQLLLEGFFSDFKKLGGDTKNAALALRYIMQDSSRLQEYMGLVKESLEDAYKSLAGFLESILEAVEGLSTKVANALKKVSEWASNLLKKVKSFVEGALAGDGWKGAMILSGALVGIGFIWSKLEGPAPKILEGLAKLKEAVEESALLAGSYLFEGEDEEEVPEDSKAGKIIKKITSLLFTVVKKIGVKAFKGLAVDTIGAALTGGISAAFKALKALYGGSKIVFMFLGDPIKKFLGKIKNPEEEAEEAEDGEDDPTESKNEALLREWVRGLLKEDPIGFVHDLAASDKFGDQFFGGKVDKEAGREIKRAFANNADHQFLSTLDTVHWTGDFYSMEGLKGKSKDELSATMTLSGEDFDYPLDYGLWIKGRITLAANEQDNLYSGFYGDYGAGSEGSEEEVAHRDKSSGRNKRPTISKDYSRYGKLKRGNEFGEKMARENIPYVLDQSTWNPSKTKSNNEALVDNWRPVGIILTRGDEINAISGLEYIEGTKEDVEEFAMGVIKKIMLTAIELGVPVYDTEREMLWSPK